jgi:RNA polymerase sigma-70 factor (ECF subfamily)
MAAPSDEELMLAYAGGDAGAFDRLYERHRGPLFRLVLRSVKSAAEAEELYQDVWMKVIEARGRYVVTAKFTTWLYTVAHNRLVDYWRKRGLALVPVENEDGEPVIEARAGPFDEPSRIHEARETLATFREALAALPPAQREAFLLHHEGDLSVAEIAEATGSNEEAAKSRLRYAMDKLRKALGDG